MPKSARQLPKGPTRKQWAITAGQKLTAGILATTAVLTGVAQTFGLLPVFWPTLPVIEVHQHQDQNPFRTVFKVSNAGDLFPIERAQIFCKLEQVKVGLDTWNTRSATDQLNTIAPNSTLTTPCVFPPGQAEYLNQAREGAVTVIVEYQNPIWFDRTSAAKTFYLSTHDAVMRWTEDKPVQILPY